MLCRGDLQESSIAPHFERTKQPELQTAPPSLKHLSRLRSLSTLTEFRMSKSSAVRAPSSAGETMATLTTRRELVLNGFRLRAYFGQAPALLTNSAGVVPVKVRNSRIM